MATRASYKDSNLAFLLGHLCLHHGRREVGIGLVLLPTSYSTDHR